MLNFGRFIHPNRFGASVLVAPHTLSVAGRLKNFLALTTAESIGGGEGVRTPDLRLAKPALCQTELRPLFQSVLGEVGCGGGI